MSSAVSHKQPPTLVTVKAVHTGGPPRGSLAAPARDRDDFNFQGRRARRQSHSVHSRSVHSRSQDKEPDKSARSHSSQGVHIEVAQAVFSQRRNSTSSHKARSHSPHSKEHDQQASRSDSGRLSVETLSPPTHTRGLSDVLEGDERPVVRGRRRLTPVSPHYPISRKPKIERIDFSKVTLSCDKEKGTCTVSNLFLEGAHLNALHNTMREQFSDSKILKFVNCRFTKDGILRLRNFNQQLTELDLSDSSVDLESEGSEFYLRFLSSLTHVKKISFAFWQGLPIQNGQFEAVAKMMHALVAIDLSHTDCKRADLEQFVHFPALTEVNISDCVKISDRGFQNLATIRTLSRLLMAGCEITAYGFEQLGVAINRNETQLTELDLSRTSFNDEWFKPLLHFSRLQKLTLIRCNQITGKNLFHGTGKVNIPDSLTHIDLTQCLRLQGAYLVEFAKTNVKFINLKQCDRTLVTKNHIDHLLSWYKGDDKIRIKSEYDDVEDLSPLMAGLSLSPVSQGRGTTPTYGQASDAQSNGSRARGSSAAKSDDVPEAAHTPTKEKTESKKENGKKDSGKGKAETSETYVCCGDDCCVIL